MPVTTAIEVLLDYLIENEQSELEGAFKRNGKSYKLTLKEIEEKSDEKQIPKTT